jgi:hypothetical protein
MPIITQIVCDGCQAVKKETNHWYTIARHEEEAWVRPLDVTLRRRTDVSVFGTELYFCGRKCALEALAYWMDSLGG